KAVGDEDGHRHEDEQRFPGEQGRAQRLVEPVGDGARALNRSGHAAMPLRRSRISHACTFLRMTRPFLRSPRALSTTARMMALPEIAICQKGETLTTGSADWMMPRKSAPRTAPATEPMPPAMETPPMTQAA